jgi:hypothetical protein
MVILKPTFGFWLFNKIDMILLYFLLFNRAKYKSNGAAAKRKLSKSILLHPAKDMFCDNDRIRTCEAEANRYLIRLMNSSLSP